MRSRQFSFSETKKIPITTYLLSLGLEPARVRGIDYWYYSPFRQERTPSFKVNTRLNVWFDHGTGEGGTLLDLGARLNACTAKEFVETLAAQNYLPAFVETTASIAAAPEKRLEILSTRPLAASYLIGYLASRGISIETASKYCVEVDFRIPPRTYQAVGFPNRSGGFELRNTWFKGSSSPKDISLIQRHSRKICILEGFMDFLSLLELDTQEIKPLTDDSDFLVLNSLSFLKRSVSVIKSYPRRILLLDNDLPGRQAKAFLAARQMEFHDASSLFGPSKDANEYLMSQMKTRGRHLRGRVIP